MRHCAHRSQLPVDALTSSTRPHVSTSPPEVPAAGSYLSHFFWTHLSPFSWMLPPSPPPSSVPAWGHGLSILTVSQQRLTDIPEAVGQEGRPAMGAALCPLSSESLDLPMPWGEALLASLSDLNRPCPPALPPTPHRQPFLVLGFRHVGSYSEVMFEIEDFNCIWKQHRDIASVCECCWSF